MRSNFGIFYFLLAILLSHNEFAVCRDVLIAAQANPHKEELARYENTRVLSLDAAAPIENFRGQTGISVLERDGNGHAIKGKIRVLVDNSHSSIAVIGPFNDWGRALRPEDFLKPIADTPYFEGEIRGLRHGMEYRLLENGEQRIDPGGRRY